MKTDTNRFVLDASAIMAMLLPDEKESSHEQQLINSLIQPNNILLSSPLLFYEVANALRSAVVQKRIAKVNIATLVKRFESIPIRLISTPIQEVIEQALINELSVYDGVYLYLAQTERAHLVTFDKRLKSITENI